MNSERAVIIFFVLRHCVSQSGLKETGQVMGKPIVPIDKGDAH